MITIMTIALLITGLVLIGIGFICRYQVRKHAGDADVNIAVLTDRFFTAYLLLTLIGLIMINMAMDADVNKFRKHEKPTAWSK